MNAIAPKQTSPLAQLKNDLDANGRIYVKLLKADDQELARFVAEAFQAVRANPKLLEANRSTLLMAIGEAASLGLSVNPNLGEAYLIPRWNNRASCNEVNFQVGYKGLVKLAYRSNLIDSFYVEVVYRNEHYVRRGGTDPMIDHIPDDTGECRTNNYDDIVAAYAVVWLKGSTRPIFRPVSKRDLDTARNASGGKNGPSSVWQSHPEAMCRKTALIRVTSMLPRDDKLRALHEVAEREGMLEGGDDRPVLPGLEQIRTSAPAPNSLEAMMGGSKPAPSRELAEAPPEMDEDFEPVHD